MARTGILGEDDRVELLDGEIVQMAPIGSPHAVAVTLAAEALRRCTGRGFHIRVQQPLALGERSEPEPAVAVVAGHIRDYLAEHPTAAVLVVEVADTSLSIDRGLKASLYAAAGVSDCWILELRGRRLHVLREPDAAPGVRGGARYTQVQILKRGDQIAPLFAPEYAIPVADLLP